MLTKIIVEVITKLATKLFTWFGGVVTNWVDHINDKKDINDAFENENRTQGATDLNDVFTN